MGAWPARRSNASASRSSRLMRCMRPRNSTTNASGGMPRRARYRARMACCAAVRDRRRSARRRPARRDGDRGAPRPPAPRSRAVAPRRADCGARAAIRHRLSPSAALHRLRLQHAPRRHHVRQPPARARRRRPPLRHVPDAVDVADVGASQRRRSAGARSRAPKNRRGNAAATYRTGTPSYSLAAGRRRRPAACRRWPSSSPPRRPCRRAAGPGTSRAPRPAARPY